MLEDREYLDILDKNQKRLGTNLKQYNFDKVESIYAKFDNNGWDTLLSDAKSTAEKGRGTLPIRRALERFKHIENKQVKRWNTGKRAPLWFLRLAVAYIACKSDLALMEAHLNLFHDWERKTLREDYSTLEDIDETGRAYFEIMLYYERHITAFSTRKKSVLTRVWADNPYPLQIDERWARVLGHFSFRGYQDNSVQERNRVIYRRTQKELLNQVNDAIVSIFGVGAKINDNTVKYQRIVSEIIAQSFTPIFNGKGKSNNIPEEVFGLSGDSMYAFLRASFDECARPHRYINSVLFELKDKKKVEQVRALLVGSGAKVFPNDVVTSERKNPTVILDPEYRGRIFSVVQRYNDTIDGWDFDEKHIASWAAGKLDISQSLLQDICYTITHEVLHLNPSFDVYELSWVKVKPHIIKTYLRSRTSFSISKLRNMRNFNTNISFGLESKKKRLDEIEADLDKKAR